MKCLVVCCTESSTEGEKLLLDDGRLMCVETGAQPETKTSYREGSAVGVTVTLSLSRSFPSTQLCTPQEL
jgi:hypothetical protein